MVQRKRGARPQGRGESESRARGLTSLRGGILPRGSLQGVFDRLPDARPWPEHRPQPRLSLSRPFTRSDSKCSLTPLNQSSGCRPTSCVQGAETRTLPQKVQT